MALTETLLDESVGEVTLTGYTLVSRRERRDGRKGGGIVLFVKTDTKGSMNLLEHSDCSERSWHLVHTTHGLFY